MIILLIVLIVLAVVFGPQWWAQYTFKRYATPRNDIPGSGAELARHLLDQLAMTQVKVEQTQDHGDHYDPVAKAVRLGPNNFNDNSLTAITVAAHEVGHAIQDHRNEPMLAWRGKLVGLANRVQRLGAGLLLLIPIIALLTRSPLLDLLFFVAGIASLGVATLVHLVTLPVETSTPPRPPTAPSISPPPSRSAPTSTRPPSTSTTGCSSPRRACRTRCGATA